MSGVLSTARTEAPVTESARDWAKVLSRFRRSSSTRGVIELAITVLPFLAAWAAMAFAIIHGHIWLFAMLVPPTAGLVVRLFMIQHDCGHGSFFPLRAANDWTGRILGVFTLTPYGYWRRTHAIHHATSGNLDARGIGDVDTLTVREYRARSRWGRLRYRVYRHPAIMFGLGPALLFGIQYRFPLGCMRTPDAWVSTMGTNAAILGLAGVAVWVVGLAPFLLVHLPVMVLAASIGVWLFYVQHQFEGTQWAQAGDWSVHEAALHGSSHYDLPPILRWFTANIGVHHVHHLASRIPYYRLPAVLRAHPELRQVGRLTISRSLACVRLVLWDETAGRLVSFRDLPAFVAASVTSAAAERGPGSGGMPPLPVVTQRG